jgi:hypothetical protein
MSSACVRFILYVCAYCDCVCVHVCVRDKILHVICLWKSLFLKGKKGLYSLSFGFHCCLSNPFPSQYAPSHTKFNGHKKLIEFNLNIHICIVLCGIFYYKLYCRIILLGGIDLHTTSSYENITNCFKFRTGHSYDT